MVMGDADLAGAPMGEMGTDGPDDLIGAPGANGAQHVFPCGNAASRAIPARTTRLSCTP